MYKNVVFLCTLVIVLRDVTAIFKLNTYLNSYLTKYRDDLIKNYVENHLHVHGPHVHKQPQQEHQKQPLHLNQDIPVDNTYPLPHYVSDADNNPQNYVQQYFPVVDFGQYNQIPPLTPFVSEFDNTIYEVPQYEPQYEPQYVRVRHYQPQSHPQYQPQSEPKPNDADQTLAGIPTEVSNLFDFVTNKPKQVENCNDETPSTPPKNEVEQESFRYIVEYQRKAKPKPSGNHEIHEIDHSISKEIKKIQDSINQSNKLNNGVDIVYEIGQHNNKIKHNLNSNVQSNHLDHKHNVKDHHKKLHHKHHYKHKHHKHHKHLHKYKNYKHDHKDSSNSLQLHKDHIDHYNDIYRNGKAKKSYSEAYFKQWN